MTLASLPLLWLTGCTKGKIVGTITDALTGQPVEGVRVIAKAPLATDMTCSTLEGVTDASGTFTIEGTCVNNSYNLKIGDDMLLLKGELTVEGGEAEPVSRSYEVWTAPEGTSVYFLVGGEMIAQKTLSDIGTATILDSEPPQAVRYPEVRLSTWPQLEPGSYLVVTGISNMDQLKLHPMVESPEVKFSPDREDITHWSLGKEWDYVGISMTAEGAYELKTVEADASMVKEVRGTENRGARYIPAEALPPGRYALLKDKAKRTYMFEVGGSTAPAEEAPADAPAEPGSAE